MSRHTLRALPVVVMMALFAAPAFAGEVEERNKTIARTVLEEALGKGKVEETEALYSPEFVTHGSTGDVRRAEDRELMKGWKRAFPDLQITIDKMVAEGDLVAVRFVAEGTNTGAANGLPATGKRIRIAGMTLLRIVNGKIVEEWPSFDQLDFLRQLGLMPAPQKGG
jgi:steroid delta-isomerase-like uncharacterized protein